MSTFSDLDQILAWKKARLLAKEVYLVTNQLPLQKDYALCNQMKRSVGSTMDNIAEGFGRGGNKEFIHFLFISRASATELRSQLYRAGDVNLISIKKTETLVEMVTETEKIISGLIRYLKSKQSQNYKDSM